MPMFRRILSMRIFTFVVSQYRSPSLVGSADGERDTGSKDRNRALEGDVVAVELLNVRVFFSRFQSSCVDNWRAGR